jgi:hypothetical protein
MSQLITVKAKYRDTVIGFNNSGKPLGLRDDLHLLLEIAKASNVQYLLDMFEEVPSEEAIVEEKEKAFIEKKKAVKKRKQKSPPNNQSE